VLRGGTIKELLDASAEVFGNPIGVHDTALECVAETDYSDKIQEQLSICRRNDSAYIKSFLEDPEYNQSLQQRRAFFSESSSTSGRTLAQNLFLYDQFIYRIVITERFRQLDPQDAALLEHLSNYVTSLLSSGGGWPNAGQISVPTLLERIISGEITDIGSVQMYFHARGWRAGEYYICIVFQRGDIDVFSSTEKAIAQRLRQYVPRSEVFFHEKLLVVFADVGSKTADLNDISHPYMEFMRDMNMKCGMSNLIYGYQHLRSQYVQASSALRIGQSTRGYCWLFRFNDVAPFYIMEQCSKTLPIPAICAPEIMEMLRYDSSHSTNYFQTLKEYLDCNLNLAETSKHLFIHRTTLIYRLDKMTALFKLDVHTPVRRIYYHLSVQMIAYTSYIEENLNE